MAHEIAHSWTGNLVTNRNFEHFWMNEGFTVYVERRIDGLLYGESSREFAALGGLEDLKQSVIIILHIVMYNNTYKLYIYVCVYFRLID